MPSLSLYVTEQIGLSETWSQTTKTGFHSLHVCPRFVFFTIFTLDVGGGLWSLIEARPGDLLNTRH